MRTIILYYSIWFFVRIHFLTNVISMFNIVKLANAIFRKLTINFIIIKVIIIEKYKFWDY